MFLLLLGSIVHAETVDRQTAINIERMDGETALRASVLAFEPAVDQQGTEYKDVIENEIIPECQAEGATDLMACITEKSIERTAASRNYQSNIVSIEHAQLKVSYLNPLTNTYSPVQGCAELYADDVKTSSQVGVPEEYYAECDISSVVEGSPRATFRVEYIPDPDSNTLPSNAYHEYDGESVSPADQLTTQINNVITGISSSTGLGGQSLPCVGIFLILGLLLSSLYFAGKSPIALLDITTPRLPAPKGVTAGGQMLMPFGYAEMKRATKGKMKAAAVALTASTAALSASRRGDAALSRLRSRIAALRGTAADRAAGDVAEGKKIADAAVTAGRAVGMSERELAKLAGTLPYHYGDAEHRTIAQIIEKLEKTGKGREQLMAMTLKDYQLGMRQFQTLEVITAHPDIGQRSVLHQKASNLLVKAYGVNRYAIVGGFVPGMLDSTVRTARVGVRGVKTGIQKAPELARSMARTGKTTMAMLGGRHDIEELGAASGRREAAYLAGKAAKHPADVVVGQMFPVGDKMGHLYKTLNDEANHDSMRYVLRQIYKKMGVRFDVAEAELAKMGYVDMDILKRSGYKHTPEMAALEKELKRILSNGTLTSQEKLAALLKVADSHGAKIDSRMIQFNERIMAIHESGEPEHIKLLMLQEELERQNTARISSTAAGALHEDSYVCHVGGDSLRGSQVWETMVLRTMIWDAEHGHLEGGLREELLSARLNVANRVGTLDPSKDIAALPSYMRNQSELEAVAARNKADLIQLFSEDGKKLFREHNKGQSIESASIDTIVNFMYGGHMPGTGTVDKKTGRMVWWGADQELTLPQGSFLVDAKRHWVSEHKPAEHYAIAPWIESRTTGGRSYTTFYRASIEAELDRMPGSANWTNEQRAKEMQKLFLKEELMKDMESRFNSQFGLNSYGTTRETTRFYSGIVAGFVEKALHDKGLSSNHPDLTFVQSMDHSNPQDLSRLKGILKTYNKEYEATVNKPVTYNDIAKSDKAMVMLHEGGFAYYQKGMMLSDADRIMGGQTALRDNKGQLKEFIPDETVANFAGRDDLQARYMKVMGSKNPSDWHGFIDSTIKWAKEGGYSYEKEKTLAAVLWQYGNTTYDYERFWKHSAVTVEAKHKVTRLAPTPMRFFGYDGHEMDRFMKPFREFAQHGGDYVSQVALGAGGSLQKASYEITAVSEYYRQHSWQLANRVLSGHGMEGLSDAERVAYRNAAMEHAAYHQVWDYAIDRNPWRKSTSHGMQQTYAASFQYGPAMNFKVRDNLGAYMSKGEYANFMSLYGFPMDLAGKMMAPYIGMIRGAQMSMQGYASKWDTTDNALRQWNYTEPRLREAMQSLNPFSTRWFSGKTSERIAKLNVWGGSLEQHQLAGPEYYTGLRQAPQDIQTQSKGVYSNARTGEANPATSQYNYRHELQYAEPMAEFLYRNKEAAYLYDKKVRDAALSTTQRRTVSAEVLAMTRERELRGFGITQNPLFGWASPVGFAWHMPVPFYPQSATLKDITAGMVRRAKHPEAGGGGGWEAAVNRVGQSISTGTKKFFSPGALQRQCHCGRCGRSGMRGGTCVCGATLY